MLELKIFTFGTLCLISIYFLGWILNSRKPKGKKMNLSEISVVIPFRNEEKNLYNLLDSIQELKNSPLEFVFVNDHSEDNSFQIIDNFALNKEHKILELEDASFGKKAALDLGIRKAKGKWILTWDADISFNVEYFSLMEELSENDLTILPVKMEGDNLISVFSSLDFYYLNALNVSLSGYKVPIVASGANLLFKKEFYISLVQNKKHKQYSSGDDIFLLYEFKKAKLQINNSVLNGLSVKTPVQKTVLAILNQRLRWIGKSKRVGDTFANLIGIFGLLYHFFGFYLIVFSEYQLYFFVLKMLVDSLFFMPYLISLKRIEYLFFVPLFSLFYPFYVLTILFSSLFYEPKWKNRKVVS